jgi:hypothetical protein
MSPHFVCLRCLFTVVRYPTLLALEPLELERHLYSLLRHVLQLSSIDAAARAIAGPRWARVLVAIVLPPVSPAWDSGGCLSRRCTLIVGWVFNGDSGLTQRVCHLLSQETNQLFVTRNKPVLCAPLLPLGPTLCLYFFLNHYQRESTHMVAYTWTILLHYMFSKPRLNSPPFCLWRVGRVLLLADGDVSGWSPRCRRVALVIVSSVCRYVSPAAMKEVYQEVRTACPLKGTLFKRCRRPKCEAHM